MGRRKRRSRIGRRRLHDGLVHRDRNRSGRGRPRLLDDNRSRSRRRDGHDYSVGAGRRRPRIGRLRHRLRRDRRRRRRCSLRWKQSEGINVALRIARSPNSEVDVGVDAFRVAAGPDRPHDRPLGDNLAAADEERSEVHEGDRVAVGSLDGHRLAAVRNRAGERNAAAGRRGDRRAGGRADVDASVLPARIGVVAEHEWPQHRPFDGPRPCLRG